MRFNVRTCVMTGVGIVAASTIAIPQSVAPISPAPRHQNVALAAQVRPINPLIQQNIATAQAAAALLPPEALTSTEALTETLDVASAQVNALALPGLQDAIIGAYETIMPWVDWVVNLSIYATQWIPIVNWFTPQISIVYDTLVDPIITSAVFNFAFWVGGTVSFTQGLTNFFNDTVNAGVNFVNAEIDWFLSFLPPLPPFPPFFSALAAESTMEIMGARTALEIPAVDASSIEETAEDQTPGEAPPSAESGIAPTTPPAQAPTDTEIENAEGENPAGQNTGGQDPTDEELIDQSGKDDDLASQDPAEAPADTENGDLNDHADTGDTGDTDTGNGPTTEAKKHTTAPATAERGPTPKTRSDSAPRPKSGASPRSGAESDG